MPLTRALAVDADAYDVPRFGNVSLLHFTDSHAQLRPLRRRGIRREVRHAHTCAEDDDTPLLEVPSRAQR